MPQTSRAAGLVLVVMSALFFSSAGIFTKGVEAAAWEVIFWRGLSAVFFTTLYIMWRGTFRFDYFQMGKWGLTVAITGALGSAAFIQAFKHTDVANVALIYAAAPLLAALIAYLWIGERLSPAVAVGCMFALLGVTLIVGGSINSLNLKGDLLALLMTIVMSVIIVIYRVHPEVPAAGPAALSSAILLPFGLWLGEPLAISTRDILTTIVFGLVFAFASVALVEGAKRLPSAEASLLSSMEAPFAVVLAWMFLAEIPVWATVLGGGLILLGAAGSQFENRKYRST